MHLEKWQWAWLAGLFEGEGTITFTNVNSVQVKIAMTDKDVIEAVERLIPSPTGVRPYLFAHKKDQWVWNVASKEIVEPLLRGLRPFLGVRRSARAEEALQRLANNRGARSKRTHCPRGHALAGDNLYVTRTTGAHSCLTCREAYSLRRSERQKEERRIAREGRHAAQEFEYLKTLAQSAFESVASLSP